MVLLAINELSIECYEVHIVGILVDMYSIERHDPLATVLARYNSARCVLSAKEKLSHSSCRGVSLPHKFIVSRVQIHKLSSVSAVALCTLPTQK